MEARRSLSSHASLRSIFNHACGPSLLPSLSRLFAVAAPVSWKFANHEHCPVRRIHAASTGKQGVTSGSTGLGPMGSQARIKYDGCQWWHNDVFMHAVGLLQACVCTPLNPGQTAGGPPQDLHKIAACPYVKLRLTAMGLLSDSSETAQQRH